jgi:branched-chain amino acid transport system substrate-binding protein
VSSTYQSRRRMEMKSGMKIILAILVSLLATSPSYSEAAEVKVSQWEIPFINSWTGAAAGYGKLSDFFQKEAVKEINAAGGIAGKPLVIEDLDDGMDPTRAASMMKKAAEKSLVIIGPMTSLSAQVGAPIAAQQKVMTIAASTGVEVLQESRPWAVSFSFPNSKRAEFMMNAWLDRNPGIKKVVMMNFPKVAQWKTLVPMRQQALSKRGVETLDVIDVDAGAVDVSSVIVRALKSKPDGIVLSLMPADTVRIVSELEKRGFKDKKAICSHGTVDSPELYSLSAEAGGVMEGTFLETFDSPRTDPSYLKVLGEFRKVKGQENAPKLIWCDHYYTATYLVKAAIEGTGATGDPAKLAEERVKIRDYINSVKDFDSRTRGLISALPDGSFTISGFLGVVKNNQLEIVASSDSYFKK